MNNIRKRRKQKGLSGERLGALVGVQKAAISKYELEVAQPSKDVLLKMAGVLECSIDYLLGNTDDPTPSGIKKSDPGNDIYTDELLVTLSRHVKDLTKSQKDQILNFTRFMLEQTNDDDKQ